MINGMQDKEQDMMLAHNLPNFDLWDMTQAYLENDTYRTDPRATVTWTHEILSFSPSDAAHIDNQKLEQITEEYIRRRNSRALCFAVSHMSEGHKHIHMVFSSTEYHQKKSLRMSNKVFKELREGMEEFQMEHFPERKHSIVYLDREKQKQQYRGKGTSKEREYQAKKRLKDTPLEKEQLSCMVQNCYDQSKSAQKFINLLQSNGLELYERNGKPAGVMGKRKYRFSTLGITKDMLLALDRFAKRQREADRISRGRDNEMELER